jgi:hypothetical protein
MIGVQSPTGAEDFSSSPFVQTGSGANPALYPMGTGGPFPGGKARPGRDANHSPPTSAEVKNEQELYLLSPHAPPWRVAGSLYLYLSASIRIHLSVDRLVLCVSTAACCFPRERESNMFNEAR